MDGEPYMCIEENQGGSWRMSIAYRADNGRVPVEIFDAIGQIMAHGYPMVSIGL
jgi:hypothetical protein